MEILHGNHRTTEEGKINSILLIDNEHENVTELQIMLNRAAQGGFAEGEGVIYVSSPDAAVRNMIDSMNEGKGYSAIIADNHMDIDAENDVQTIDGQDFIRVIQGNAAYCFSHSPVDLNLDGYRRFRNFGGLVDYTIGRSERNRFGHVGNVLEFMNRNFQNPRKYADFVDYYFGRVETPFVMMLCGHPRYVDRNGLEDIDLVGKGDSVGCERRVLDLLIDEGILHEEIEGSAYEDSRYDGKSHNLCKGYNPCASKIRRFLGKGKRFSR